MSHFSFAGCYLAVVLLVQAASSSATTVVSSTATAASLLSFINSTSSLELLSFSVSSTVSVCTLSEQSKLSVGSSTISVSFTHAVPFLSSGHLVLDDISLKSSTVFNNAFSTLSFCNDSLSSVLVQNSILQNVAAVVGDYSIISSGLMKEQTVRNTHFTNISLAQFQDGDPHIHPPTVVGYCRLDCSSVSESFDTVHGSLLSGVSEQTISAFSCANSSFHNCNREPILFNQFKRVRNSYEIEFEDCSLLSDHVEVDANKSFSHCSPFNTSSFAVSGNDVVLTFISCNFISCSSYESGGSLFFNPSDSSSFYSLRVEFCIFDQSTAGYHGGAISAYNVTNAVFIETTFENCSASGNGGSLYLQAPSSSSSDLMIDGCNLNNCNTTQSGGAIFIQNIANTSIKNTTFCSCSAESEGGALCFNGANGSILLEDLFFANNNASNHSDLCSPSEFDLTIKDCLTQTCSSSLTGLASSYGSLICINDAHWKSNTTQSQSELTCKGEVVTQDCVKLTEAVTVAFSNNIIDYCIRVPSDSYSTSDTVFSTLHDHTVHITSNSSELVNYNLTGNGVNFFNMTVGSLSLSYFAFHLNTDLSGDKSLFLKKGGKRLTLSSVTIESSELLHSSVFRLETGDVQLNSLSVSNINEKASLITILCASLTIDCGSTFSNILRFNGSGAILEIANSVCNITIKNTTFDSCISGINGGALALQLGQSTFTLGGKTNDRINTIFKGCEGDRGGAIWISNREPNHFTINDGVQFEEKGTYFSASRRPKYIYYEYGTDGDNKDWAKDKDKIKTVPEIDYSDVAYFAVSKEGNDLEPMFPHENHYLLIAIVIPCLLLVCCGLVGLYLFCQCRTRLPQP